MKDNSYTLLRSQESCLKCVYYKTEKCYNGESWTDCYTGVKLMKQRKRREEIKKHARNNSKIYR